MVWAGTGACPYNRAWPGEDDDAVDMVRHDHEGVSFDAGIPFRDLVPDCLHHFTSIRQAYFLTCYITQEARPILCADRHEICSGLSVIVSVQAKGTPVVDVHDIIQQMGSIAWAFPQTQTERGVGAKHPPFSFVCPRNGQSRMLRLYGTWLGIMTMAGTWACPYRRRPVRPIRKTRPRQGATPLRYNTSLRRGGWGTLLLC